MVSTVQSQWWARLATLALAALAAGSAVYWVLKWPSAPAQVSVAEEPAAASLDSSAVARALGGGAAPVANAVAPVSSRFVLAGVVSGGVHRGAALIAVDGKPAKPYRVGAVVAEQWVLSAVQPRRVVLAPQASGAADAGITLELPPKK
ncbi:MAG: general secretion pathway protein C [Rhodoferax sp.]|nr:general secretion pathway protein C [Rhodoferax sp.]